MGSWDVLSFSLRLDWSDGIGHTVKFLLPRFARERKVLNFNPPWEWRQAYKHPTKLYRVQDNLWHFEWGRLFPFLRRPKAAVHTTAFLRALCVRWLCARLGIEEYIYLVWNPAQAPVVQGLPRRFTVYYAYDQFDKFYHEKQEWLKETVTQQGILASLSEVAFGVSLGIVETLKEEGFERAFYSPNGVDYDRFLSQTGREPPADLKGTSAPHLCYVGGLYHKTDFALLHHIAESLNHCSLVLIGPVGGAMEDSRRAALNQLFSRPNVLYLGRRRLDEIPAYLVSMDVGLAPFDITSDAYFCSPLKVYEYLAAGLPVVSSPIPEVLKMGDIVYTASSPEEWVGQIERALREDSPDLRRRRQEFARQHSWDNRAKQVMEIIEEAYREWRAKV